MLFSLDAALLAVATAWVPSLGTEVPEPSRLPVMQEAALAEAVSIDVPPVVLGGVPITVTVTLADSETSLPYRLVSAAGRQLAVGTLVPGSDVAIADLSLHSEDMPLALEIGPEGERGSVAIAPRFLPGWVSLLPPLVAIALALVFHEVVVSLFLGVWLGALFYAGLNPITATLRTIDSFILPAVADADHMAIIIFSMLLGGMVGIVGRSGGTRGIVEAVSPIATTPRRAQLATFLSGLAIFFDDYANTLIVGNTMRPITDRMKVSREKLAYIVDSTAAPVAAIVFVSTWVGFEISLIGDGLRIAATQPSTSPDASGALLSASPFSVFLHSIPYLFYPILALLMVGLIILTQRDFGPMHAAENRASRGDGLFREDAMLLVDTSSSDMEPSETAPLRWYNAALPVVTVIVVVLLGLYFDGRRGVDESASIWDIFGAANAFHALLWGSLSGCIVAIGLAVGQRILSMQQAIQAWLAGIRSMMLAFVILSLAWSLGEVTEVLGTAPYLTGLMSDALAPQLLPTLVFVTAAVVAFATGTSWATMAILLPLVVPLAVALGGGLDLSGGVYHPHLLGAISAVLAGAIWGDHCSPISDTTVLSSMASASDHVDHVRTQLPYAVVVALVAIAVGSVPTAFGMPPILSYPLGALVLFLILRFAGRPDLESPQWREARAAAD